MKKNESMELIKRYVKSAFHVFGFDIQRRGVSLESFKKKY